MPLPGTLWGAYDLNQNTIFLRPGLTRAAYRSTLAHELIHAQNGHNGHQNPAIEDWVNQQAAKLLINPADYAATETIYGHDPRTLARELELMPWIIQSWQKQQQLVV